MIYIETMIYHPVGKVAVFFLLIYAVLVLLPKMLQFIQRKKIYEKIDELCMNAVPYSVESFRTKRKKEMKLKPEYKKHFNCKGVYILHNVTKDKYYVGQSIHLMDRVNQHFSGTGNQELYYDYAISKDYFIIRMIPLKDSGFRSLNTLERFAIGRYQGFVKGYNKNRGNKTKDNKKQKEN